MVAVLLQVIPSIYSNYSKNRLFISANLYEIYIVSKEYFIARHDNKMCFLPNCRYHIILVGTLKSCYSYWMHSVSTTNTWTVCIHFSSTASVAKLFSRVDNSLGQFISTSKTEKWTDCPASRKRLLRKNFKKALEEIC